MKLSELVKFVHDSGRWQSENCYETKVTKIHNTLVIANLYTYGNREEREAAHDSILVDVDRKGKLGKVASVSCESPIDLCDRRVRKLYGELMEAGAMDGYVVEVDV